MTKEQLKRALAYAGITQTQAAAILGLTKQNFNNKLQRMSFTDDQLQQLATAINARFISCFEFQDGTRI